MFVSTNVLSRQAYFCRDKRRVLCRQTRDCPDKIVLSRQTRDCRDKKVLSRQKMLLAPALANDSVNPVKTAILVFPHTARGILGWIRKRPMNRNPLYYY